MRATATIGCMVHSRWAGRAQGALLQTARTPVGARHARDRNDRLHGAPRMERSRTRCAPTWPRGDAAISYVQTRPSAIDEATAFADSSTMKGQSALRRGRCSIVGQVYLLTSVTDARRHRFADFESARAACQAIHDHASWRSTRCLAWVLMPDH